MKSRRRSIGLATIVLLASCHRPWPSVDATAVDTNTAAEGTAPCAAGFRLARERSGDLGPLVAAREARHAARARAQAVLGDGRIVLDALELGDALVIAYDSDAMLSIGVQRRDGSVERSTALPSYGMRVAVLTSVGDRVAIAYGSVDRDALGFAIWDPRTGAFTDPPRRLTGLFPGGSPDVGGTEPTSMLWHDGRVWIGIEPPSGCRHCPCRRPPYAIVAVTPGGSHTTAAMHADVTPRLPRCEIRETFELRARADVTGRSVAGEVVPLHGRPRSRATVRAVCKRF
jgi:hypothetical protein